MQGDILGSQPDQRYLIYVFEGLMSRLFGYLKAYRAEMHLRGVPGTP